LSVPPSEGCADGSLHGSASEPPPDCSVCHLSPPDGGPAVLVAPDVYTLCIGCHDGSAAETDVVRGRSTKTGARLNGGGFQSVPDGDRVAQATTSRHDVAGLPQDEGGTSDGLGTAWGSLGPSGSGPGVSGVLTCTSCHDPHGSTNYRLLRDAAGAADRWLPGEPYVATWQSYQVLLAADGCNYAAGDSADYTAGMRDFCASCHTEYLTPGPGAGEHQPSSPFDAGDGEGAVARVRHTQVFEYEGPLGRPLRLAASAAPGGLDADGEWGAGEVLAQLSTETERTSVVCTTCHLAHGSAAVAGTYAEGVPPAGDSTLLYYDRRGVCLACHQFDK
jgi:hypothetical protein